MITIISGVPGTGKTALLVEMMMEQIREGRRIHTIGIPKLLLDVQEGGDPHTWQDGTWLKIDHYNPTLMRSKGNLEAQWFPRGCSEQCQFLNSCYRVGSLNKDINADAGSLLIIDEAHAFFPQRASGKAPPPYVEALTVHRHQGLDIWFISQRPSFLDPFVRGLASQHIHLGLNPFSFTGQRKKYIWSEYQETVNRTSKLLASTSNYKPSPAVFPLYHSATIHTVLDQRMPTIAKVFIVMLLVLISMVALAFSRVQARVNDVRAQQAQIVSQPVQPAHVSSSADTIAEPVQFSDFEQVASAPAAAPVFVPTLAAPVPQNVQIKSCLASENRCQCYTDHGIRVPMTDEECRVHAEQPTFRYKYEQPTQAVYVPS